MIENERQLKSGQVTKHIQRSYEELKLTLPHEEKMQHDGNSAVLVFTLIICFTIISFAWIVWRK